MGYPSFMLYLIAHVALAAEPATLRSPPPNGVDLEQVGEGWRFERAVEMDGQLISESGLAVDGHIQRLTWSASGSAADALAAWHTTHSPSIGCAGPRDRWVAVRDGVVYERTTETASGQWRLIAQEELHPSASCALFVPSPVEPRELSVEPPQAPTVQSPRKLAVPAPMRGPIPVKGLARPQVAKDPSPEIAQRIHIESTDISEQPLERIAGWCLAEHPVGGTFHWEAHKESWQMASDPTRTAESKRLASCLDAMLAPMPARGAVTITLSP